LQDSGSFFVPRLTLDESLPSDEPLDVEVASGPEWLEPFDWAPQAPDIDDLEDTTPFAQRVVVGELVGIPSEDTTAVRPMSGPSPIARGATLVLDDDLLAELQVRDTATHSRHPVLGTTDELDVTERLVPSRSGSSRVESRDDNSDEPLLADQSPEQKAYRLYELAIAAYKSGNLLSAKLQMHLATVCAPDNRVYRLALERFSDELNGDA
jgi:hypothetical protein